MQEDQGDSWAQTLQRIAAERKQHEPVKEATGRGVRRAAAAVIPKVSELLHG